MIRKRYALVLVLVAVAVLVGGSYAAGFHGKHRVKGDRLTGFQETPLTLFSNGTGSFKAAIDKSATPPKITFELTYSGLSAPAAASHIHFGSRFTSGGVVAFLCGGSKPACPPGTTTEATVTGTIIAADVLAQVPNQGIPAGGFDQLVKAIRAGVTYVNVHTSTFPGGEIRAQINDRNERESDHHGSHH